MPYKDPKKQKEAMQRLNKKYTAIGYWKQVRKARKQKRLEGIDNISSYDNIKLLNN